MLSVEPDSIKPKAVDTKRAADVLGLCDRTVRKLVMSGDLGSFRVGKRRLIPVAEIDAFIERQMERRDEAA